MRIAFIRPTLGMQHGRPYHSRAIMEPLAFAVLAGLTPSAHTVMLFDERLEPVPVHERFDLAAITVETYTAQRAYQLADALRRNGTPVVLGGFHPTLLPAEAAEHADAVLIGEADALWPEILADAETARLQPCYRAEERPALGGIRPDRSIFAGKSYLPLALVQYSRGCENHCDFCAIRQFYPGRQRHRPVGEVVDELRGLRTRNVFFVDDNLTGNREAAYELLQAIKPLKLRWASQVGLDVARDPALLDLMAVSGCVALTIGLESLNPRNLAQMRKGWAAGDSAAALAEIARRGILIYGTFIFGYDGDTPESFDATVEFAIAQRFCLANFNLLQPFPGTPLYARLRAEGRLLYDRWWLDADFLWHRAAFRPTGMSAEELAEGCRRARQRFNSAGSILWRLFNSQTHLRDPARTAFYLTANLVSRQDISRKQGLSLGFPENRLVEGRL